MIIPPTNQGMIVKLGLGCSRNPPFEVAKAEIASSPPLVQQKRPPLVGGLSLSRLSPQPLRSSGRVEAGRWVAAVRYRTSTMHWMPGAAASLASVVSNDVAGSISVRATYVAS